MSLFLFNLYSEIVYAFSYELLTLRVLLSFKPEKAFTDAAFLFLRT